MTGLLPFVDRFVAQCPPLRLGGLEIRGDERRWALFSPCDRYRYALGVLWDERPIFDVVMMNPSTADHQIDDPTFRKVRHFAVRNGCGGLLIRNLAALRATSPDVLWRDLAPIGPDNLRVLSIDLPGSIRVAAWGRMSKAQRLRVTDTMDRARRYCTRALRIGVDGDPWHPLYLPNATDLVVFGGKVTA